MKKIAIIPLFAISLGACTRLNVSEFVKHENQVSFEEYLEAFTASGFANYFNYDKSFIGEATSEYITSEYIKNGSYVLYENGGEKEYKHSFKYDYSSALSYASVKATGDSNGKGADEKDQSVFSISFNRYFQPQEIEGERKIVSIDKKEEVYYLTDFENTGLACTKMAASTYEECTFTQEEYEALPQKRKDALTFFVDGNVFTGVLDSKETRNGPLNPDDHPYFTEIVEENAIFQYEIIDSTLAVFRVKLTYVENTKYFDHYDNHAKGTEVSVVTNFSHTMELRYKDVKITSTETKDFALRDYDLLMESMF